MEALVKFLPAAVYEEIASQELSLLDCGCAEGDGTEVLCRMFPRSQVAGFDFSSTAIARARDRFPSLNLFVSTFDSLDRSADVLISSNCFEHLEAPVAALCHLATCARRWLILLVPFLERFPPDPEHLRIVHPTTFPERLAGWVLSDRIVVPPLPVWSQLQLLLVYQPAGKVVEGSAAARPAESIVLEALVAGLVDKMEALNANQERAGREATSSLQRLEELEARRESRQNESDLQGERRHRELAARQEALDARLQNQQEELQTLRRILERSQRGVEERLAALGQLTAELELRTGEVEELRRDLGEARAAAEVSMAGAREAREIVEQLAAERLELHSRLTSLDSSLAVRSVHRFWRLVRRLAPEGTLRQRLYRQLTRPLQRRIMPPAAPSPVAEPGFPPASPSSGGEPVAMKFDVRAELQRFEQLVREIGADTVAILFSGTLLREDEGQRPTQLALSLARCGIPVVFAYWRWNRDEWCAQDRWREGIYQIPIDLAFEEPERLASLFRDCRRVALFEFPHPGLFEPLAALNAAGWITVYDVLDDWEEFHRVGQAIWYEEEFERHMAAAADAVFAVTPLLAERLCDLGAERVELVPNGLRPGLEVVGEPRAIERGEVTVGYFGHLTAAWFDWGLVIAAARLRPAWRFHLIGYGHAPERAAELPPNLLLAGKLPQSELAAWAAHWDVAIVPFKAGRLAEAADPIKTYEYLAMGLPVVVTGVAPPLGAEALVAQAAGVDDFLLQIEAAARRRHQEGEVEERRAFARSATWAHRVDTLLGALAGASPRLAQKERLFAGRP